MKSLLLLAALATSGCGTTLWLVTPRPDVSYSKVTRMTRVQVGASSPYATVFVDGAEAGFAPRRVDVPHEQVRRQRRQNVWPAILGTAIDIAFFSMLTIAAADEAPEYGLLAAGAGVGVALLDLYLINGRSVVDEGLDTLPATVEIGVLAPGHAPAARRIRVPDITSLWFQLVPDPHVVDGQVSVDRRLRIVDEDERGELPAMRGDVPAAFPQDVAAE